MIWRFALSPSADAPQPPSSLVIDCTTEQIYHSCRVWNQSINTINQRWSHWTNKQSTETWVNNEAFVTNRKAFINPILLWDYSDIKTKESYYRQYVLLSLIPRVSRKCVITSDLIWIYFGCFSLKKTDFCCIINQTKTVFHNLSLSDLIGASISTVRIHPHPPPTPAHHLPPPPGRWLL